jgi:hypothetical protein
MITMMCSMQPATPALRWKRHSTRSPDWPVRFCACVRSIDSLCVHTHTVGAPHLLVVPDTVTSLLALLELAVEYAASSGIAMPRCVRTSSISLT